MKADKAPTSRFEIPSFLVGHLITAIIVHKTIRRPPSPQKILATTSAELNRTLPMMVDKVTRLDVTYPGPGGVFVYKYTLLGAKAADLNKERIRTSVEPTLSQNYKANPSMAGLRALSAILKYTYFDEAGAFILDIAIDPKKF